MGHERLKDKTQRKQGRTFYKEDIKIELCTSILTSKCIFLFPISKNI
jgi:hypothetical protein